MEGDHECGGGMVLVLMFWVGECIEAVEGVRVYGANYVVVSYKIVRCQPGVGGGLRREGRDGCVCGC